MISLIKDFFVGMDKKEFTRYSFIYLGACLFIILLIIVRHFYLIGDEKDKIAVLNSSRKKVQNILTQFSLVKKQKEKVDTLLNKDKNFYIKKFFDTVAQKSSVDKNSKETLSKKKLENGYEEESLSIQLSQITTKQLCDTLQALEQEARVYIKFVDISKMNNARKINVAMDIATVMPQSK